MSNRVLHILYLGNALSKHGYTPTSVEYLGKFLEESGFKVTVASTKKNRLLRFLSMCSATLLFTGDIILIDTYSTSAFQYAWVCSMVAVKRRIPYIPLLHGGDLPKRIALSPRKSKTLFEKAKAIVAVSPYLRSIVESYGYPVVEIPNMIRIKDYTFIERKTFLPRLLWVRAFHHIYNPGLALMVLNGLLEKLPDAELTMVGPDKDGSQNQLIQLAQQMKIEDKVHLTGRLPKNDWITLSEDQSIFINTTNYDNMPVSVIEAMALGLPVISTNVGGMPYLIQDGVDGYLVEPGDVTGFVKRIIELIQHPEKAREMAANARKKAEGFDSAIVMAKWKSLIEGITYGV